MLICFFFFFQAEDGIRDGRVTGVQTCALPISPGEHDSLHDGTSAGLLFPKEPWFHASEDEVRRNVVGTGYPANRSEEHTSELQSPVHLVCRLLLEKKKQQTTEQHHIIHHQVQI